MTTQITMSAYDERTEQRTRILELFEQLGFVPTSVLRMVAYQYNARIFELRRPPFNYNIVRANENGRCGFRMVQG